MLLDKTEIEIMKTAKQVNLRDPGRSGLPFERMIDDFFDHQHFSGKVVLDLGPGQYDFNELARKRGAKGYAMDFDPAVIHLGQYKGFEIVEGDLRAISFGTFGHLFDGIFCRGSINAFWFAKNLDRLQLIARRWLGIYSSLEWSVSIFKFNGCYGGRNFTITAKSL